MKVNDLKNTGEQEEIRVYTYTRVSTSMQVEGFSLDAQKLRLHDYAAYRNMTIAGEYSDEGFSGKNIDGRIQFKRMMSDIVEEKDKVKFVLVFKLSRFGRNAADILSSLQLMQDYGVNLICVEDNIDSSAETGKMLISVMSAMSEMERENILAQTMAGRRQKAREGGWNGGFAPYGYKLENGKLVIAEDEAVIIRLIFDKYVHTTMGTNGVASWLNKQGHKKKLRHNGTLEAFSGGFVKQILDNPVYKGKIAYGRRRSEKIQGRRNAYHIVKQSSYDEYEGQHDAIVSEEIWNAAHTKRIQTGGIRDKKEKEHEYILSGLLICPICGAHMYGTVSHSKKKKDGTPYPPYYSYICRSGRGVTGHDCSWKHQISAPKTDNAVRDIVLSLVRNPAFETAIKELIGQQVDVSALRTELDTARKRLVRLHKTQESVELQLNDLDTDSEHYERMRESLERRLMKLFDDIEECEENIEALQQRIEGANREKLTRDSVYQYLIYFERIYDKMTDMEKKTFMQSFISGIELYPEKQPNGQWIKTIHFRFPVSYDGSLTDEISLLYQGTDETVVLMSRVEK